MSETIYVVIEHRTDVLRSTIRAAYRTESAANQYVEDPEQLGNLFVVPVPVESSYDNGSQTHN